MKHKPIDVTKRLGITRPFYYRRIKKGEVRTLGGTNLIDNAEFQRLIAEKEKSDKEKVLRALRTVRMPQGMRAIVELAATTAVSGWHHRNELEPELIFWEPTNRAARTGTARGWCKDC